MQRWSLSLIIAGCSVAMVAAFPAAAQQPSPPASDFPATLQQFDSAQEPEQKIATGERALALENQLTTWSLPEPREGVRGRLLLGIGSAYLVRVQGDRAENIEQAIRRFDQGLAVTTQATSQEAWAMLHNNAGIAFWRRIRGERADNQDQAIAHYETALAVFDSATNAQQWAQVQNNLAIAYWNRIRGERPKNIEAAISHFEACLTVFTRDAQPNLWAIVQNNLGIAYQIRPKGDKAQNAELAIASMKNALTVFTRETFATEWAQTQNNLAIVYLNRVEGDRKTNQDQAMTYLEGALTVLTPSSSPFEWATAERALANLLADRISGDSTANLQKSVASYQAALTVFTRDAMPLDHLRTARPLAKALMRIGQWKDAAPYHASARDAFFLLSGGTIGDTEVRALIAEAGPLFADAAYAAIQRGDYIGALEFANEGRGRLMAASLKLKNENLTPETRLEIDRLNARLRDLEAALEAASGPDRASVVANLANARNELLNLLKTATKQDGKVVPLLDQIRQSIGRGNALAVPIVTDLGSKILLTGGSGVAIPWSVVDLPELTTRRMSELLAGSGEQSGGWIRAYFVNYLSGPEQQERWPDWLAAIDKLGPDLWSLFGARLHAALKSRNVRPGSRLVWMPTGWLAVLPMGLAQDPSTKRRLADDYEIVNIPSIDALKAAYHNVSHSAPPSLAVVIDPTGDLPGTEKEGAIVISHFAAASRTVLEGDEATPAAVLGALKTATYWHFASHGTFSWTSPRSSGLILSGGERLSVGALLDAGGLGKPRLVVLSACETGLSDITGSPDEFIGLPGTFTALGAAGIVGTLWPVSDEATSLLMAKFYDLHIDQGLVPPTALSQAQKWLRAANSSELNAYAQRALDQGRLDRHQRNEIEIELSKLAQVRNGNNIVAGNPTRTPDGSAALYAHPYYWAGFVYTGL